ncbi:Di-copper centre-containing protein [Zopfia rhizophila CBS 207.26]|uniref:tyrosinase n=1 Tax=Zopfia rhizophila CBS 207.26 TaxID=1314779 RepID=A0A6A6EVU5_9PEZI|nr:Di-copper centre-containing protein [Zopfia rhizophila CBS 207.26]
MASSRVTATGVPTTPGPNGSVPLRREIRDLQANYRDQWNLYLLGLADLQKKPPTDLLSYYQLAGIHGEPFVPWNGVNGNTNASFGGYCTHSSILFLTWHRPYLAVYEQALYASVQKVASQFPESLRARYVAAAKDFRMPYWDWAAGVSGQNSAFPSAISSSRVNVVDVDGATKQINNPLYSFQFNDKRIPSELALDRYWSQFLNTKRAPDSNGSSQNGLVSQVITNENASLRTNVSLVLLSYKQFDAVSNNAWLRNNRPGRYGSLEDIHNEIHDKIGQGGHMGSLEVSSFDPVFWLHHCNVDRLWTIWQALNPSAFVIDKVAAAREANFTIAAGTRVTAETELKPFYDSSATKFWNSAGTKETTPFGYAYPETQRWVFPSEQAYQTSVRNEVTRQYGANVINNFFENIAAAPAAPKDTGIAVSTSEGVSEQPVLSKGFAKKAVAHPIQAAQQILHKEPAQEPALKAAEVNLPPPRAEANPAPPKPAAENASAPAPEPATVPLNVPEKFSHLVPDRTYTEWITNLRTVKHGLSQTFRVYVFLGDFNPDPASWPTEYNVVGRFTVLGRGGDTQCSKCQQDQAEELVVTGTVPLTSALLQDIVEGQLASLKPEDVEPYLVKNLHWRVTVFDGSEKPRDEVPGLKVSVVSTNVRIGDDGIPIYSGEYQAHPNITDGRPAGLAGDDEI